jgi:hypothetical protein
MSNVDRSRKYSNWGYAYDNEFVVWAEGLDVFKTGPMPLEGT